MGRSSRGRVSASIASVVDRAAAGALAWAHQRARVAGDRSGDEGERLTTLVRALAARGPRDVHPDLGPIAPKVVGSRTVRGVRPRAPLRSSVDAGGVFDVSWDGALVPSLPIAARDMPPRDSSARLWLHGEARPTLVAVHGYLGGVMAIEEAHFGASAWFERGFDVALLALPHHGSEARRRRGLPALLGADLVSSFEALRRAAADVRALTAWLRQRGAPSVALAGVSLGAYVAALSATVAPAPYARVFLMTPLASLTRLARAHEVALDDSALARIEELLAPLSPLERPWHVEASRVLVLASEGDALTPIEHAELLAQKSGGALLRFAGGHIVARRAEFREAMLRHWTSRT